MASLRPAYHPYRLPTNSSIQHLDKTGAQAQTPDGVSSNTSGFDPGVLIANRPRVNKGTSIINRDMFQIHHADYILILLSPLGPSGGEPRLDTEYFLVTSNDNELGHQVYVSYRYALSQVLHQPVTHLTMLNFLQTWLALTSVRLFSLKFNLYCWPADSLTGVFSIIFKHVDRIESTDIQGSDRHVKQFFVATNLTSIESPVINSFPRVVNQAPDFSYFNTLTFTKVITDRDCYTLLRFCCRIETIICHHVVKGENVPDNLREATLIRVHKIATLPYLKHLRIVLTDFDTTLLLEHLSCPLLSTLALTVVQTTEFSIVRLQEFLMRRMSNEPIALVNIMDYAMRAETALALLSVMYRCRWGPSSLGIQIMGIYSGVLPSALVEEFPASWNNTPSKLVLLRCLFEQYQGRVATLPHLDCIGWDATSTQL